MIIKKGNVDKPASKITSNTDKYSDARKHILAAIQILGDDAKEDTLAKESIANLSVVLLDLK